MQCLGYRNGTECKKVVRMKQHTNCWEKYQLCYICSKDPRTEEYRKSILLVA